MSDKLITFKWVAAGFLVFVTGCGLVQKISVKNVSLRTISSNSMLNTAPSTLVGLPLLQNIKINVSNNSALIQFDPVDDAKDYRVYIQPNSADIHRDIRGNLIIKNAVYRCAGNRTGPYAYPDGQSTTNYGYQSMSTIVDSTLNRIPVAGYSRREQEATLGYVYPNSGPGLVPVYRFSNLYVDAFGNNQVWAATSVKLYSTDSAQITRLAAQFYKSDGVVFYVPAAPSAKTVELWGVQNSSSGNIFFPGGTPEAAFHNGDSQKADLFPILTSQAPGSQPLMRVWISASSLNAPSAIHDELLVGKARFLAARYEGSQPLPQLSFSGDGTPKTLVVEALSSGCPHFGGFSPISSPAWTENGAYGSIAHQAWLTLSDLAQLSPLSGEIFLNGQHSVSSRPQAIARSFVAFNPAPKPEMDYFEDFSTKDDPNLVFSPVPAPAGVSSISCAGASVLESPAYNISTVCGAKLTYGAELGQFWSRFADMSADTGGQFRIAPKQKTQMNTNSFLHVTMEANDYNTGRRYPQIIISDQNLPVQYHFQTGKALIVQSRGNDANVEVQICDHRDWNVNRQCDSINLWNRRIPSVPQWAPGWQLHSPFGSIFESAGQDRTFKFDVYASTTKVFVFLDNQPYGCALLPNVGAPSGPSTVTFGYTLYHSGVDHGTNGEGGGWFFNYSSPTFSYPSWVNYDYPASSTDDIENLVHFGNLGFKQSVPSPTWDETALPCASSIDPGE